MFVKPRFLGRKPSSSSGSGDVPAHEHSVPKWTVADIAARDALSVTVDDVYKACWVIGTGELYLLTDDSPVTWEIVGSGGTSSESSFSVYLRKASQALVAGNFNKLQWNGVDYDTDNAYDVTNSWIVIPQTGIWEFVARIQQSSPAPWTAATTLSIFRDGKEAIRGLFYPTITMYVVSVTGQVYCNEGDIIDARVLSSTTTWNFGSPQLNEFSGRLASPKAANTNKWDITDSWYSVVFSGTNRETATLSASTGARGRKGRSAANSDKHYVELLVTGTAFHAGLGSFSAPISGTVSNSTTMSGNYIVMRQDGGAYGEGAILGSSSAASGQRIGVAIDVPAGLYRIYRNGVQVGTKAIVGEFLFPFVHAGAATTAEIVAAPLYTPVGFADWFE